MKKETAEIDQSTVTPKFHQFGKFVPLAKLMSHPDLGETILKSNPYFRRQQE
jgi:hypothetical protein